MLAKIKGKENLVKDQFSSCVFSTDEQGLKAAKRAKKLALEQIEYRNKLEQRIERLESALEKMLDKEDT